MPRWVNLGLGEPEKRACRIDQQYENGRCVDDATSLCADVTYSSRNRNCIAVSIEQSSTAGLGGSAGVRR